MRAIGGNAHQGEDDRGPAEGEGIVNARAGGMGDFGNVLVQISCVHFSNDPGIQTALERNLKS